MTISSSLRTSGPFTGTGLQTVFPFGFKVFQASDLLVARTDTGLVQSTLALSVDYTVTLNSDQDNAPGGSITLTTPLPAGYSLTMTSNVTLTQSASLTNAGGFFPKTIENALDRLTILLQQLGFNVGQTLRAPEIGGVTSLPAAGARANNLLGFDSAGNPVAVAPVNGSAAALATDLTNSSVAAKGAGQLGFGYALGYAVGTIGRKLQEIASAGDSGAALDGVTDDTTPLGTMTSRGRPFVLPAKAAYQYGVAGPALGTVNRVDYATIGTTDKLVNGGFTGSAASWTLSNFTYSANTITHAAGTIGQATQAITLKGYRLYLLSVTLTTTTRGQIDFQFNGATVLDDTGYYWFDPGTNTYQFAYISTAPATANFAVITDAAWAGSIDTVSFIEVQEELPLNLIGVPTDDPSLRIPYGVKWGRYNAGVVAIGDRQTMALAGSAAVWNTAIGPRTLETNQTGFENTAVGAFAGHWTTTSRNTFYGYSAGKYNTVGVDLTFIGYKAGAANTVGQRNDAHGKHTLMQNTAGNDNFAAGWQALYNVLNTSGNTAVGSQCAMNNRGTENTYVGALAGYLNADTNQTYTYNYGVTIGAEAKVYGDNGVAVGMQSQIGADGSPNTNSIVIGKGVTLRASNAVKIGTSTTSLATPGRVFSYQNSGSDGTTAGITYTTAQFVQNTVFTRSGPGAPFNDTTPTAAAIVAAMPGAEVGTGYELKLRNTSGFTLTLLAGAGVTLGGNTTIATNQCRTYVVYPTNVGAGTEAVTVIGVETCAV